MSRARGIDVVALSASDEVTDGVWEVHVTAWVTADKDADARDAVNEALEGWKP